MQSFYFPSLLELSTYFDYTNNSYNHIIDIFVYFNPTYKPEDIEKETLAIFLKCLSDLSDLAQDGLRFKMRCNNPVSLEDEKIKEILESEDIVQIKEARKYIEPEKLKEVSKKLSSKKYLKLKDIITKLNLSQKVIK